MSPLTLLVTPPTAPALGPDDPVKILRAEAESLERAGDWGKAAVKYEELIRLDRTQAVFRERYQFCLLRYLQAVRFRDGSYQKDVLTLKYSQAVRLYEIVLFNLLHNTLDKEKVPPAVLFHKGLEEFRFALASPEFCSDHLEGRKPDETKGLRNALQALFADRKTMTYEEAVDAVREAAMKSKNHFPNVNPTTVVMEFLCGACLAMDDYTVYLTPRQLRELCATLKGHHVGVGLRLKLEDNKPVVAEVLPDSPAAEVMPSLVAGDHVAAIGKKSTLGMSPETAMDLLEGEEGTTIEIVVASPKHGHRMIVLSRRALFIPSVHQEILGQVGYLKIQCFQETTLAEFDAKLTDLMERDCKALILDLRGNPGGLLDVSIEIAKRFLRNGTIVSTQHMDPKSSKTYLSDNPMALTIPVVVLVDGDTASAAEVLAGALKENGRATVVGQTTYGKGCSQGLLKLPGEGELRFPAGSNAGGATGGIRITIARFFSPTGHPYSGHGVEPDVPVDGELQVYQAQKLAQDLIGMR
ncbi:MAG TPA: S41 family peptidase [Gemmataceae bacterium]|nr:S41 family peptidase [Gemmataceae bacterium]